MRAFGGYDYISANVRCPFYRGIDTEHFYIGCEGITDQAVTKIQWHGKKAMADYMDSFCCDKYRNCPVFIMINNSKYGGEA